MHRWRMPRHRHRIEYLNARARHEDRLAELERYESYRDYEEASRRTRNYWRNVIVFVLALAAFLALGVAALHFAIVR